MEKGDKLVVFNYKNFTGENLKVALSICWEQMYPEKIAALVSQKAEFIVFMNNDSWFGYSPGSKQLLNISRLRAIENRKAIARCSNGGISCFIDPFGNIYGEIPWFKADISTQKLKANQKWSFYTKYPFGFLYLSGILGAILLLVFEVQSKKE
jgi:apolipoprotein N-acyltransferase